MSPFRIATYVTVVVVLGSAVWLFVIAHEPPRSATDLSALAPILTTVVLVPGFWIFAIFTWAVRTYSRGKDESRPLK